MKGFYQRRSDGQMADMPPCGLCLHKNKATYQSPCYNCIDIVDLCLHRPNAETEFANFVPAEGVEAVFQKRTLKTPQSETTSSGITIFGRESSSYRLPTSILAAVTAAVRSAPNRDGRTRRYV